MIVIHIKFRPGYVSCIKRKMKCKQWPTRFCTTIISNESSMHFENLQIINGNSLAIKYCVVRCFSVPLETPFPVSSKRMRIIMRALYDPSFYCVIFCDSYEKSVYKFTVINWTNGERKLPSKNSRIIYKKFVAKIVDWSVRWTIYWD